MNWWLIIAIFLIVLTIILLAGMVLVDENYGYGALVTFILLWLLVDVYLWVRAIMYLLDYSNGTPNTLDWVEVLGFIAILGTIFGSSTRASSS